MSCTLKNFSNIATLALDIRPLILSVAILIVSIFPLRGGGGGMCYSAMYLWLVGFIYRGSGLAAFSIGRLVLLRFLSGG